MESSSVAVPIPEKIGRFTIQRKIGRGAMSEVYEGYDEQHSRRVAVKLLSADLAADADALKRIEREARILEMIRHPHVTQLYEFGKSESGRPFLVFELVSGRSLQVIIEERMPVAWETGLTWMLHAAEALDEAWKNHVIHRDIKPGNVMIDDEGKARLVDFGLAKAIYQEKDKSHEKIVLGTPRYMSPEMGLGQSLDFRADMYSLGATFYHLFAGQAPFDAETLMGLVMKHSQAPLTPPKSIEPNLPDDINDILCHLMEKDPAKRYQSYSDLISDLTEARLALMARAKPAEDHFDPATGGNPALADPRLWQSAETPLPGTQAAKGRPIALGPMKPRPDVASLPVSARTDRVTVSLIAAIFFVLGLAALRIYFTKENKLEPQAPKQSSGWLARKISSIKPLDRVEHPKIKSEEMIEENKDRMQRVMSMIIRFHLSNNQYPENLEKLEKTGLASDPLLRDAWGNRFGYNPSDLTITSAGADGIEGNEDDYVMNSSLKFTKLPQWPPN
ncbi:protein kinase [Candidatus Sumerlaeota bacterium]|nr:protein kinase [Candidatus Sumerlaeota bacterium]